MTTGWPGHRNGSRATRCRPKSVAELDIQWAEWVSIPPPWDEESVLVLLTVHQRRPKVPVTCAVVPNPDHASRAFAGSCSHVVVTGAAQATMTI